MNINNAQVTPPKVFHDTVRALALRAMEAGEQPTGPGSIKWRVSGDCQEPLTRLVTARPSRGQLDKHIVVKPGSPHPYWVELEVRCRRCDRCRELRRRKWAQRARAETGVSARTWFGTLTASPEQQYLWLAAARHAEWLQGVELDALSYGEQFLARHKQASKEVTKYLKRVRKDACGPLRLLVVAEAHKSGAPHYHVLLHEQVLGAVKHRTLESQWKCGFSSWKVVDEVCRADYLCKYLAKSTAARVRASVGYGKHVLQHSWVFGKTHFSEHTRGPLTHPLPREPLFKGEYLQYDKVYGAEGIDWHDPLPF